VTEGHQSQRSIDANRSWFADNAAYAQGIAQLDTYRTIRAAIDEQVAGVGRLLDVGNGGVFDYNTSLAHEIVAVDLFLDDAPPETGPPNVTFRQGDALALDEPDGSYDAVLVALVLHHLVGERTSDLVPNLRRAVAEAHRVLRPGGRLIVVESCVPSWFRSIERVAFRPLTLLARTPLLSHPATMQLPAREIGALMAERFAPVDGRELPVGRWILQFGRRWPSALTPARPWVLTGIRS
jgi:SAM-dependent methyltransferase